MGDAPSAPSLETRTAIIGSLANTSADASGLEESRIGDAVEAGTVDRRTSLSVRKANATVRACGWAGGCDSSKDRDGRTGIERRTWMQTLLSFMAHREVARARVGLQS